MRKHALAITQLILQAFFDVGFDTGFQSLPAMVRLCTPGRLHYAAPMLQDSVACA